MIYIQKQRTPEAVKKKATELTLAPENHYKQIVLPQDTKKLRVHHSPFLSFTKSFRYCDGVIPVTALKTRLK